ncbi:hypothetical protein C6Q05_23070 [Burkholderia multivorans]|nr:hypothetical protein C6Q05_23070 [Burkholderia multivorans]
MPGRAAAASRSNISRRTRSSASPHRAGGPGRARPARARRPAPPRRADRHPDQPPFVTIVFHAPFFT